MSVQYLLDENLPPLYQEQLLRYQSNLTVLLNNLLTGLRQKTRRKKPQSQS